jgi:hypothetical protein
MDTTYSCNTYSCNTYSCNTYSCNVNDNDILKTLISLSSTRKNLLEQRDMYLKHSSIYNDFILTLIDNDKYNYKKIEMVGIHEILRDIENTYDKIETIAIHLSLQIQLLEKHGFTLLYLLPSDVSVITLSLGGVGGVGGVGGHTIYLLTNLTNIVPLSKDNSDCLVLTYPLVYPFPKNVCAPELYDLNILPFITHRSAVYYSLGLLCLSFFTNLSLINLRDTPLFYFLERCLKKDPVERLCYFV